MRTGRPASRMLCRQHMRRCFHISRPQLQQPQPNSAKDIAKALGLAGDVPSTPTSIKPWKEHFTSLMDAVVAPSGPPQQSQEPLVSAAPTPTGYNSKIYDTAKKLAEKKKYPTPTQLSDLFRLMEFDSPNGELKDEALVIWRAVREKGIRPTIQGYEALFKLAMDSGDSLMLEELLQALPQDGIELSARMIHAFICSHRITREAEKAILLFRQIREAGKFQVKPVTYEMMIGTCTDLNEAEEAFSILKEMVDMFGSQLVREDLWWTVLESCAREYYHPGVVYCWRTVYHPDAIISEGLCLQILSVAQRYGDPALATQVFDALANLKVPYREHYFYPLIDAYGRAKEFRNAFIVLGLMRETCPTPPRYHQLDSFIGAVGESGQTLDRAFFILQDMVEKEGKKVDIEAVNVLLEACVRLPDISRAVTTYGDINKLKVQPNLGTFNILLRAAQVVGHVNLCMHILSNLKEAKCTPNQETYETVILTFVNLPTKEYDPAFIYLEEMKAAGFIPTWGLYKAFVVKCVYHRDERAEKLLEEMDKLGHSTDGLRKYLLGSRVTFNPEDIDYRMRILATPNIDEDGNWITRSRLGNRGLAGEQPKEVRQEVTSEGPEGAEEEVSQLGAEVTEEIRQGVAEGVNPVPEEAKEDVKEEVKEPEESLVKAGGQQ